LEGGEGGLKQNRIRLEKRGKEKKGVRGGIMRGISYVALKGGSQGKGGRGKGRSMEGRKGRDGKLFTGPLGRYPHHTAGRNR